MNVLFISRNLLAGNLAQTIQKEGHSVKLYIEEEQSKECLDGLVEKTNNWKAELTWVGKDGLIIFDDSGYGTEQDNLRNQGYAVIGGCALGDKLETNRAWAQSIFRAYGLPALPTYDFTSFDQAISFVEEHKGSWVIKQNKQTLKEVNYVGEFEDGSDVVSILEDYKKLYKDIGVVTLQKKVVGIEIGVGRFFNGHDWVGPIEINIEYPRLFPGNLGPMTNEMGTLAWYIDNESNKLYQETLVKLMPYLREIGFKGDIEINCIVNERGAYVLEATPRFGSPIIHLQTEIHNSPWGEFLNAIARGQNYKLRWKKGFGVVVLVTVPPFPYSKKLPEYSAYGTTIHFDNLNDTERSHVHFEEVAKSKGEKDSFYVADSQGYILYVTGLASTVSLSRKKMYDIVQKIRIPNMFYRNDIGVNFIDGNEIILRKLGYLD